MSEELKPPEAENGQPVAAEELAERELNEIAGGNGGGTGLHPLGPPTPGG